MPKSSALRLSVLLATLFVSSFIYAQKNVTGVVKEKNGPVVGATVSVKGTNFAAQTVQGILLRNAFAEFFRRANTQKLFQAAA